MTPAERLLREARELQQRQARGEPLPLYGLTFAVKDNIDVAGLPTTAACPALASTPAQHAPVVARLLQAGALCVGKTNLDQLATGLTGVRSPYGVARNPFDPAFVPGGSSSGSAVAVALGQVDFALGTDTAGSGRVPAAFNNIVGLKPSRGLLSTTGVVPACPSLDCVSIFSLTVEDAVRVADLARGADDGDPFSRPEADAFRFGGAVRPPRFRFGIPAGAALDFRGDLPPPPASRAPSSGRARWAASRSRSTSPPSTRRAALVYEGAFVAERLIAGGALLAEQPAALLPPVREILSGARRIDARAVFETNRRVAQLRRAAVRALAAVDFLLVPTAPTIPRVADVQADPLRLNAALGAFTTFVNPLDLAALAVPAGFRDDGLPAGVTLVGPWGSDARLAAFGGALHRATSDRLGALDRTLPPEVPATGAVPEGWIAIAVVGAHLSGEPLNHQLTDLGGRFVRATRTAPVYRFYALPNTTPPKPGLVRSPEGGGSIALEVWALPPAAFGLFVSKIPAPLVIGRITLEDGTAVSGFLCESFAVSGATDITASGGWRRFLSRPEPAA